MNYKAYNLEVLSIFRSLSDDRKDGFINRYNERAKIPLSYSDLAPF
jgi:hypothetical protein